MTDIHCHLLFGVDDGPETIEESVAMLELAKEQGIERIILTPHYRHGMFMHPREQIETNLHKLLPYAEKLGIELALGTEYHVNSEIIPAMEAGRCYTLAGSQYVLCEYSHNTEYETICRMTRELLSHGYIPVIAHVERYQCIASDIHRSMELKELGAWLQINADAVLGLEGRGPKKFCKKMISYSLVDVIASDSHGVLNRACHLLECKAYVTKKFGADMAERLLKLNPQRIWMKSL